MKLRCGDGSSCWRCLPGVCFLALLMFLLPLVGHAQGYFGTVSGGVTDQTGAVIPGANVTLTDQEKGYVFHAVSDTAGRYLFRSIPPGLYTVASEMSGFEKVVRTNVRLSVSENATANLTLKVASNVQSVEVTAQRETINVEDATTGQVINRRFINDLPLVDRNVMDLTYLTPGVTEMDDQCSNCGGTNFVSNGSRGSTADILMDGATMTNYEPNGGVTTATYSPSSEAVEEFKVQQSNFSAEYGFSGSSVINMVTRSGTNSFLGSGYDFVRNQVFDANNWFNNHWGVKIPGLRRNNYGGTFGGPIRKNKTFFFVDYDGWREADMGTYHAGMPSTAERGGDFGEVCSGAGGSGFSDGSNGVTAGLCVDGAGSFFPAGQLWDPYSGVYQATDDGNGAFRSSAVPYNNFATYASAGNSKLDGTTYQLSGGVGDLIDPVAKKMIGMMPTPNITNGNQTIYNNWAASGAYHYYQDQFDVKLDHRFSESNLFSAKYSQKWDHNTTFNCFGNYVDPCSTGKNWVHIHLLSLNDTYTFTPTLLLTTTFGFTRGANKTREYTEYGGVTDPLSELGFSSYLNDEGWMGVPAVYLSDSYNSAGSTYVGNDPYGNYKQGQDTGQLGFALSKQLKSQELKVGFEGRLHQQNYLQTNAPNGVFSFGNGGTNACPTGYDSCGGDSLASFMIGNASGVGYQIQFEQATQNYQYAWYLQDNWKPRTGLTVNLGIRYDVTIPRTERHNRQEWFDPDATSPLSGQTSLGALKGGEVFASSSQRHAYDTDWRDIQPRVGFSWELRPDWVLRGGYGIYYAQSRSGASGNGSYSSNGFNESTSAITTYKNDGATPYLHMSNPFPSGPMQPTGSTLGLATDIGFGATGPLRHQNDTPYAETWSLGVQHQFGWHTTLDVEYIGKHGVHLYYAGLNQLNHLGAEVENYSQDQINNLNAWVSNPFYGVITDEHSALSAETYWNAQFSLPYPQFTAVSTEPKTAAYSIYHALQVTAEKSYSNGLQMLVSYTWSKSIDDSSVDDDNVTWLGSFTSLQDPNKPWLERSLSTFDIPAVFQASYTYELPFGRGRRYLNRIPMALEQVIGGWRTNGVWRMADGRPLDFTLADGVALPSYGSQRPNLTGKPKRAAHDWIDGYISNPDVVAKPDAYVLGSAPRAYGGLRTPKSFSSNVSVEKDFLLDSIRKGWKLEFRMEAQNALNHPVFGTPDSSVDDGSFGTITYTSVGPRQVQFGAKLLF